MWLSKENHAIIILNGFVKLKMFVGTVCGSFSNALSFLCVWSLIGVDADAVFFPLKSDYSFNYVYFICQLTHRCDTVCPVEQPVLSLTA